MFTSTVEVLQNIINDAINGEHRAEGESAYDGLTSFEFVFILHLEKELWRSLINFAKLRKANLKTF